MPAWLLTLLIKAGVSLALTLLQKTGMINSAEAWGVRAGTHIITTTKVEDTYPTNTALRDSPGD